MGKQYVLALQTRGVQAGFRSRMENDVPAHGALHCFCRTCSYTFLTAQVCPHRLRWCVLLPRGSRRKQGAWCFTFRAVALHFYALGRLVARTHEARFWAPKIQQQELALKYAACGELCSVAVTEPAAWSQCSCFLELFGLLCAQCYR